ncbi:MAG TPA: hypothetical protein VFJ43_04850, partial [Bacteroidia bacterium]|nr:hypothetical protein [Bacteroidia bacterium]
LIADLDLDLLKKLRSHGSVRNLQDRRTDIYDLKKLKPNGRFELLQNYADNHPVLHFLNPIILKDEPVR